MKKQLESLGKILGTDRKTDSPIEEILYQEFLRYGIKPIPQYSIGVFFADLAFPDVKLIIEADGQAWHSTKEQIERDKYRADKIASLGWRIERYTGSYIHKNFQAIVAKVMLQFFEDKMTDEQIFHAKGRIVDFLTRNRFTELAGQIVDEEIEARNLLLN